MIELFVAFGAGLISFLSPCVLPLIPGYISYILGSSLNELLEKKSINLIPIILFTVGFSLVFIAFGATATFLGSIILNNSYELRIVAGLIIIVFSLHIMGVINLKFLNYEKRIKAEKNSENNTRTIIERMIAATLSVSIWRTLRFKYHPIPPAPKNPTTVAARKATSHV